jgi:5-amino-6-(5-phosphoribosylamino)uracil reductase
MSLVQTLLDRQAPADPLLTPALREMYDGDLRFPDAPAASSGPATQDAVTRVEPNVAPGPPARAVVARVGVVERPYVIANFVTTLDGTASFKLLGASSGSIISASDTGDRFIMGLLRASVDAILVGAHTIHDTGPSGLWIPWETYPDARALYCDYRQNVLHKPTNPLVVTVSGSGKLDLDRAAFRSAEAPTLILTTAAGEQELVRRGAAGLPSLEIKVLSAAGPIAPSAILDLLASQYGVRRLLHEGGPTLFGEFLAAKAVDEFFLTLSPQVAGRLPHTIRPGIVEGVEFLPATAPWFDLLTVKQSAAYLYLRYRRKP